MSVIAHWCPEHRQPMSAMDAKEADYYCTVEGCGRDLETVECDLVPIGQHRGAVEENARMRAVMAEAVDEIQNRRVEDAIQMLLNALDAGGSKHDDPSTTGPEGGMSQCWTLQGAPLGRTHVVAGPSITSVEQPDGIGVEVDVVPVSHLDQARAEERQRIVERLLHAANLLDPDEVSRTAITLEKMAMVLIAEGEE